MSVTFAEFTKLATKRRWTPEMLAVRFRGKIDEPSVFFHRVLGGQAPQSLIPYRSVLDFYAQTIADKPESIISKPTCACGCGERVFDRKKWATQACRQRVARKRRKRVANAQFGAS